MPFTYKLLNQCVASPRSYVKFALGIRPADIRTLELTARVPLTSMLRTYALPVKLLVPELYSPVLEIKLPAVILLVILVFVPVKLATNMFAALK